MAILAECPQCHEKQAVANRLCKCGADLVKLKRAGKVKYWIKYRDADKKQRKEPVSYSIEEARAAEGKVKAQAYFPTLKINLASFNSELGGKIISHIKPVDLENYQTKRKAAGYSDSYVDQGIGAAKTVVNKAFDNDIVSGETVKVFKRVKKLLKRNANARDKVLTPEQVDCLMEHLPRHTRAIPATGFYTGMRRGEILSLTWDKVDMEKRFIHLEATDTKDKEPRHIPICDELAEILKAVPRALHDNHVFLYKGKPINDIRTGLTEACEAAGIPYGRFTKDGFVFHDLRHTFNTYMRKAGVPESVIMEITGHSTREMFDRYNTVDHDDKTDAIKQLQGFLRNGSKDSEGKVLE